MTIKVTNPYVEKIAAISVPLSKVIETLMEDRGMTIDEAAEHIKLALIAIDVEHVKKGKVSINEIRKWNGLEPIEGPVPAIDPYLEGIMNRDHKFTW